MEDCVPSKIGLLSRVPRRLNIQTDTGELVHLEKVNAILERVVSDPGVAASGFSLHIQISWKGDVVSDQDVASIRAFRARPD